jgi:hypothetical protein
MRGTIFQKGHPSCPTSGSSLTAKIKKILADQPTRHMLHDPDIYPNPMEFNPDRFNGIDSEMKKATNPIFGFGRRLCPGIHFADGTLFAIIATTLAICDILPGLDEKGNEVLPRYAYTSGTIVYVQLFFSSFSNCF